MWRKAWFGAGIAVSLVGVACAGGCSSSSGGGPPSDGGGIDGTSDGATSSDAGSDATADTGHAHVACTPDLPYTPVPWQPPSPWGQGACSSAQIAAFIAACVTTQSGAFFPFGQLSQGCAAFLADKNNTACAGCMTTDTKDAGATLGPTYITTNKGVPTINLNLGGCVAHEDGMTAAGGCGEVAIDQLHCVLSECSDCDDFVHDPSLPDGPHSQACFAASQAAGAPCNPYALPQSCVNEGMAGGVAQLCGGGSSPATWIALWCGSPDAGVQDAGGGG